MNYFLSNPACIAGVRVSSPNFKAECGRTHTHREENRILSPQLYPLSHGGAANLRCLIKADFKNESPGLFTSGQFS